MSGTREWQCWAHMKARCTKPGHPAFKNYGGRGITVCDRWLAGFENFIADMGKKPDPRMDIDRIDNAKGYEPGNCRWANRVTNMRNKRNNRTITAFGQTRCLTEWAALYDISVQALRYRIRQGWPIEMALTHPKTGRRPAALDAEPEPAPTAPHHR